MKVLLACLVLLSAALSCYCKWDSEWEAWKTKYGKKYASFWEELRARDIWLQNLEYIRAHNNNPDVTFTVAMNQFGDQMMKRDLTFKATPNDGTAARSRESPSHPLFQPPPPYSWDWRKKGVITPVRNQGQMGSADAFAVTECLESVHAIRTGQLVELSVQEVVDCCSRDRFLLPNPYECIAKLGGLCTEAAYPRTANSTTCRSKQCTAVPTNVTKTVHTPKGDEQAMVMAVLMSPLVVYVDASHSGFMMYSSGIYSSPDPSCGKTLDHAMQLVGYGVDKDKSTPYWILKNSWGPEWGMQGYMLMRRNQNVCGVADAAEYPQ